MADFFLLDGLKQDEIRFIMSHFSYEKSFAKGDVINNTPKDRAAIGYIDSGSAKCFVKDTDVVMRSFHAGDVFGATNLFEDIEVSRIVASTACKAVFFERSMFQELLVSYPTLSMNYIRFLTGRVCFLNQKIELYSMDNAERKVYSYLVSQADEKGDVFVTNMSLISKTLGVGRTTLYRSLNQLECKGIISKNGKIYHLKEFSI